MEKFTRLKRVSWKSKNNVFLYNGKDIINLLNDFEGEIDVVIIPKGHKKNIDLSTLDIIELDRKTQEQDINMSIDISEVDNVKVGHYVGAAANLAIILGKDYYWKNIIIFNH